ncbi:1,3-beta-glucan synthase component domain-containing protein, putative [Eimeria praecox]|uniref:1,3-beta-glucan synthase component domain-containing protein, putative n=1 Tax=Eimeria praecox TaxID=51316 RepID=U6H5W0_9EIME|nr:1,3-beta-glucan synthase component domain-containing protein, putative [Eimeria praecox]
MAGVGGGMDCLERERLVKANILYIDGRDLRRSRMLNYSPLGRNVEEKTQETQFDQSNACNSNDSLLSRYVLEILVFLCKSDSRFYAKRFGVPASDYRKTLQDYNKVGIAGALSPPPYTIEQTIWYVVKRQYRFQTDSMYNQLEDVCVSILNLSLMEAPSGSPVLGPGVLLASLDEYHSRLFANYYKWCDYLGATPFPWRSPPWLDDSFCATESSQADEEATGDAGDSTAEICSSQTRQELQQMMFEVATFKLLWAEAANLRHTPELLCWLFHWLCMAWDKKYKPEEDFIDLIRDVIQRIRDEQWYMASSLRTPDHNARLIYDDFNELFWSRQCLDILDELTKDTETSEQGITRKVQMIHPSADTESSLDHQSAAKQSLKPPTKRGCSMGLSVSRESLNAVVSELSCASKPGSGVKTFVEHRTYAQVLRNFWRVFAWHVTTFAGIFLLYAVLDEESSYSARKQWAVMTLTATLTYGMLPVFDLILVDYRTLARPQWWQVAWKRVPIHSARIGFALAALVIVALDGLDSVHLQWTGYIPAVLQGFIWLPAFLIWLFDMQIFFLLFGAFYGSIDGYIRRVGYITNCRKIQQRLLPLLPLTAIFRLPGDKATEEKRLFESKTATVSYIAGKGNADFGSE